MICDGPVRDVVESRDLGFPVFSRSVTPRTARGRIVEQAFNEPVTIGGVTVGPGDLVLADAPGVVVIAAARGHDVVAGRGYAPGVVGCGSIMMDSAEYQRRQAPAGVKSTSRAFGRDRRYPITNRFRPGD